MCNFCSKIFDESKIWSGRATKKNVEERDRLREFKNVLGKKYDGNYILYNASKNELDIFAETGDCFCEGVIENINYCPYCGEKLEKAVR